ncbi:endonuclease domain-containing protein [Streptomyces sp. NPDC018059]|uniref:endonuclease domain-containing protein n=1 Tax=Streptomyces sp. NPDC018059 TaxID=3365041 RepID=UPI0037AB5CCF
MLSVPNADPPGSSAHARSATACRTHRLYRMDCTEYDMLRARAAGHCEMCGVPGSETALGRLVIDHAHEYGPGAVRGLLCSSCNSALGVADRGSSAARQQFQAYMANAWFMQIAAWARTAGNLFWERPQDGFQVLEAARRYSAVLVVEQLLGFPPTMAVHTAVSPGRVALCASATFSAPDLKVRIVVSHGTTRVLVIEEMTVELAGHDPAKFSSTSDVTRYLRAARSAA